MTDSRPIRSSPPPSPLSRPLTGQVTHSQPSTDSFSNTARSTRLGEPVQPSLRSPVRASLPELPAAPSRLAIWRSDPFSPELRQWHKAAQGQIEVLNDGRYHSETEQQALLRNYKENLTRMIRAPGFKDTEDAFRHSVHQELARVRVLMETPQKDLQTTEPVKSNPVESVESTFQFAKLTGSYAQRTQKALESPEAVLKFDPMYEQLFPILKRVNQLDPELLEASGTLKELSKKLAAVESPDDQLFPKRFFGPRKNLIAEFYRKYDVRDFPLSDLKKLEEHLYTLNKLGKELQGLPEPNLPWVQSQKSRLQEYQQTLDALSSYPHLTQSIAREFRQKSQLIGHLSEQLGELESSLGRPASAAQIKIETLLQNAANDTQVTILLVTTAEEFRKQKLSAEESSKQALSYVSRRLKSAKLDSFPRAIEELSRFTFRAELQGIDLAISKLKAEQQKIKNVLKEAKASGSELHQAIFLFEESIIDLKIKSLELEQKIKLSSIGPQNDIEQDKLHRELFDTKKRQLQQEIAYNSYNTRKIVASKKSNPQVLEDKNTAYRVLLQDLQDLAKNENKRREIFAKNADKSTLLAVFKSDIREITGSNLVDIEEELYNIEMNRQLALNNLDSTTDAMKNLVSGTLALGNQAVSTLFSPLESTRQLFQGTPENIQKLKEAWESLAQWARKYPLQAARFAGNINHVSSILQGKNIIQTAWDRGTLENQVRDLVLGRREYLAAQKEVHALPPAALGLLCAADIAPVVGHVANAVTGGSAAGRMASNVTYLGINIAAYAAGVGPIVTMIAAYGGSVAAAAAAGYVEHGAVQSIARFVKRNRDLEVMTNAVWEGLQNPGTFSEQLKTTAKYIITRNAIRELGSYGVDSSEGKTARWFREKWEFIKNGFRKSSTAAKVGILVGGAVAGAAAATTLAVTTAVGWPIIAAGAAVGLLAAGALALAKWILFPSKKVATQVREQITAERVQDIRVELEQKLESSSLYLKSRISRAGMRTDEYERLENQALEEVAQTVHEGRLKTAKDRARAIEELKESTKTQVARNFGLPDTPENAQGIYDAYKGMKEALEGKLESNKP